MHFDGLLLPKVYKDLDKRIIKELRLITLKSDAKFEGKLILDSKNDMRNLLNFNLSSGKSDHLRFDVLLLSTAYKVLAKKVQKNYLS